MSERWSKKREAAIYAAVHDAIMELRIRLQAEPLTGDALDVAIARTGDAAGVAAADAYRSPLPRSGGRASLPPPAHDYQPGDRVRRTDTAGRRREGVVVGNALRPNLVRVRMDGQRSVYAISVGLIERISSATK